MNQKEPMLEGLPYKGISCAHRAHTLQSVFEKYIGRNQKLLCGN